MGEIESAGACASVHSERGVCVCVRLGRVSMHCKHTHDTSVYVADTHTLTHKKR